MKKQGKKSKGKSKASPKETRAARSFLRNRGFRPTDIPPRLFATKAKATGKSFSDLLRSIAEMKMGGQGVGQAPKATNLAENHA